MSDNHRQEVKDAALRCVAMRKSFTNEDVERMCKARYLATFDLPREEIISLIIVTVDGKIASRGLSNGIWTFIPVGASRVEEKPKAKSLRLF